MATIYCFSSTGNSLYTAKKISYLIDGDVISMAGAPGMADDSLIGFVFPVYFWGLPRIAARYIEGLVMPKASGRYIFAVATCGGQYFGALGMLDNILKAKGAKLDYGTELVSATNYLPRYETNDTEELQQKVSQSIIDISKAVLNCEQNQVQPFGSLNKMIYKMLPDEGSDRLFTVGESCTGCAVCEKACPVKNIRVENSRPEFLHKCEHCLACLNNCPQSAIDWDNKTVGKERYRNQNIPLAELISFNS